MKFSAKALRIRGRAYKELQEYEKARKDLSSSQTIDYDDVAAEDLKFVAEKVKETDKEKVQKKLEVSCCHLPKRCLNLVIELWSDVIRWIFKVWNLLYKVWLVCIIEKIGLFTWCWYVFPLLNRANKN